MMSSVYLAQVLVCHHITDRIADLIGCPIGYPIGYRYEASYRPAR